MMKAVRKINYVATERLIRESLPLLTPAAVELFAVVTVWVTDCRAGRANYANQIARIPSWVFRDRVNFCGKMIVAGGAQFAAYYLAHELAHLKARERGHGAMFMDAFKTLCPPNLQFYEAAYKPKLAAANGIETFK